MSERKGDWLQTYSGIMYYPLDPRAEEVSIRDIAHALSRMCRFGGHCREFYSVAEHSVLVSALVPEEHALVGLLHDATEAYVADVPRPLKRHLVGYQDIELLNWRAIVNAFGMAYAVPECVREADRSACLHEASYLMPKAAWHFRRHDLPAPQGLLPDPAYNLFVTRFRNLWHARQDNLYPASQR